LRGRFGVATMAAGVALLVPAPSASASTAGDTAVSAAATTYSAMVDQWPMTVVDGRAPGNGSTPIDLNGDWQAVAGKVGSAVQFNSATSYGVADGTGGRNPAKANFAVGAVFRSSPIPDAYSGNLIQKGLWGDPGQVKLQVVPDGGGTVNCRIKGAKRAKFVASSIVIDDGEWHTALCWRQGRTLGLTVDGVTRSMTASVGSIVNSRPLSVANKNDTATSSDQLIGAIDCSVFATGADAVAAAKAAMPC
jgi:hypothetical protein